MWRVRQHVTGHETSSPGDQYSDQDAPQPAPEAGRRHLFAAATHQEAPQQLHLDPHSGAGVMTADGLAVGVLVTTGYQLRDVGDPPGSANGLDAGTIGITRLEPQLARASGKLGVALKLVTGRARPRMIFSARRGGALRPPPSS